MSGIYLHIPYCRRKCHYCNFYAFASKQYRDTFVKSLKEEIRGRKDYLDGDLIRTIYFGGGTPSLLTVSEIRDILETIAGHFEIDKDVEVTLEANPDDLNQDYLKELRRNSAINRLSIGIQSFFEEDLKYLNRVHDGRQARESIELALDTGFSNLTIDLIYGIPTLTAGHWSQNLDIFFDYRLPHLSSYALTVEPKTALHTLIKNGKLPKVQEAASIAHFDTLIKKTEERNFIHYEVSNFAKAGYYSRHNSLYWLGGHYLGIGPSAHSYNGFSRQWNISNMRQYVESEKIEQIVAEREVLTTEQKFNEYVMTSIRTSWGCDAAHIQNVFGSRYVRHLETNADSFLQKGQLTKAGGIYFLTREGKLFADGIASALFI